MEHEYKWAISGPKDFDKFKAAPALSPFKKTHAKAAVFDSYFDDAAKTLAAQNIALRLRSVDNCYEIIIKGATQIKAGLARRAEQTLPLAAKSHTRAVAALRALWRQFWPASKGPQKLFTIKNKRGLCHIKSPALEAEIAFDNCLIEAPKKTLKFYEIELEFKKGSLETFNKLAADITAQTGLEYQQKSKVATAGELL